MVIGEARDFPTLNAGAAVAGTAGAEEDCTSEPFRLDIVGDCGTTDHAVGFGGGCSRGEGGMFGAAPGGIAGEEGPKALFASAVETGAPSGLGVGANRRVAVVADGDGGNKSVMPRCMSDVIEGTFSTSFNTGREGVRSGRSSCRTCLLDEGPG